MSRFLKWSKRLKNKLSSMEASILTGDIGKAQMEFAQTGILPNNETQKKAILKLQAAQLKALKTIPSKPMEMIRGIENIPSPSGKN